MIIDIVCLVKDNNMKRFYPQLKCRMQQLFRRAYWKLLVRYANWLVIKIQEKFLHAFNQLLDQRDFIVKDIKVIVDFLTNIKSLKTEAVELRGEMEVVTELMKQAIAQNASMAMDQEEYATRYNALAERFQTAADRYKSIEVECVRRTSQRKKLMAFTTQMADCSEKVAEFTPSMWKAIVEKATVNIDGTMHFTFKKRYGVVRITEHIK